MTSHTTMSNARRGARVCRRITRRHARTFYLASHVLPRAVRADAYAVYGFCRWADDGVDCARDLDEATAHLDSARHALDRAYSGGDASPGLLTFRKAVRSRSIPRELFDALLDGMEMDLTIARYPDYAALEVYCDRVAGVVGLMMAHLFGFRHPRCLPHARSLGLAMQLTNILRDIAEDFARGRVYLPQDELARFEVTEATLAEGWVGEGFRALVRFQIDRARSFYRRAEAGISDLLGPSSRLTVRVMGRLYGAILGEIERLDYDVFRARARVPLRRKLTLFAACQSETWAEGLRRFWH